MMNRGGVLSPPTEGDPLEIAISYLRSNADSLGLSIGDLQNFQVSDLYESSHNGVTHIYLQQFHNDLPIANATINVNVLPQGQVLNVGSTFLPDLAFGGFPTTPTITADAALESLSDTFGWELTSDPQMLSADHSVNARPSLISSSGVSRVDIPAELQYVPVPGGGMELAWRLNVRPQGGEHWYDASVSATDGTLLLANDWVSHASYNVFAFPLESVHFGSRSTVIDPHDLDGSPYGWHDTNGAEGAEYTITRGNNTYAYADRDGDDVPDPDTSPDGGAELVFDFPVDFTQDPDTYQPAAVTNLFYMSNILHDVLYEFGFDEPAGNFQVNNYGKGGSGNDPVLAEAQDGADVGSRNNANFGTPPDGMSPTMQMYLFDIATPTRDGDFENGIIQHEFGHGVSNRLTGGPADASALTTIQSRGMGEGWSDFINLMMIQNPGDMARDAVGLGTYALNQPTNGPGVRSLPYSYDFAINNHTYSDIVGSFFVHDVGETWASTLWDMNWAFIQGTSLDPALPNPGMGYDPDLTHGYQLGGSGNQLAMQLVLDGMKLQPANPSMLEARDAILAADVALTGGVNQATIWTVFARRGMGFSADDGGSSSTTNITEAFDLPPESYIRGTKFYDRNENGAYDSDEYGLGGWAIYLDLNDNGTLNPGEPTATTNAIGEYIFAVNPGDYVVREVMQDKWTQTFPAGDGAHRITLPAGNETVTDIDFGNFGLPGEFRGTVWADLNQNGVRDNGEAGLPNITLFLDDDGDGLLSPGERTALSGVDGGYRFEDVDLGSRTVLQDLPDGITQTFPAEDGGYTRFVNPEDVFTGLNFGNFFLSSTLAGFVWRDHNGNGTRDPGDLGMGSVRVYLDANDDGHVSLGEVSTFTNPLGRYEFRVAPGEHVLRVAPMLGFVQSFPEDSLAHVVEVMTDELLIGNDFGLRGFAADFGDAPAPYPTRSSNGGAAHEFMPGLALGTLNSADLNGQPSVGAAADDDDGVNFLTAIEAGLSATVEARVTGSGELSAWIDFNRDGIWDAAEEQIIANQQVGSGTHQFTFDVPETAVAGVSFARFRLSTDSGLLPTGIAFDGEVEDYAVTLINNIPAPDEPDDGGTGTGQIPGIPVSFTNPVNRHDVDRDGNISLSDALAIVSDLRANGAHALSAPVAPVSFFVDTNGDSRVNISDALEVVRALILARANGSGEGESQAASAVAAKSGSATVSQAEHKQAEWVVGDDSQSANHDQALLAETAVAKKESSPGICLSVELEESVDLIADDLVFGE